MPDSMQNRRSIMVETLGRTWHDLLRAKIKAAQNELLICSPYVTEDGCRFYKEYMSPEFRSRGKLRVLSDLSPVNLVQRSTDPKAIQKLFSDVTSWKLRHLPHLHAKVYVFDCTYAIVTSANLTVGGLHRNFEIGVGISDQVTVLRLRDEVLAYSKLGAPVHSDELNIYCELAVKVQAQYASLLKSAKRKARQEFERSLGELDSYLIRLRTSGGPVTSLFAQTIVFLLERRGPLSTKELHPLIQEIHPDLCDDTVDRVIDGVHYGKKWKHWIRSAQQRLKSTGRITLEDGKWKLV